MMGLFTWRLPCRACRRKIAERAKTCPYCGEPEPLGGVIGTISWLHSVLMRVLIFVLIFMVLVTIFILIGDWYFGI